MKINTVKDTREEAKGISSFPPSKSKEDLLTQYKESKYSFVHHGSNERRNNNSGTGNGPTAPNL
jgi:hypothetical protein